MLRFTALAMLGVASQAAGHSQSHMFDSICHRDSTEPAQSFVQGSPMEANLMSIINSELCSKSCPCPAEASWAFTLPEEQLAYYGRSSEDLVFKADGRTFGSF